MDPKKGAEELIVYGIEEYQMQLFKVAEIGEANAMVRA